ncbi:MAG: hypothetical protein ACJA2W_003266 [Planctomycetota bacterium]|jgi:hypothetical protein
MMINTRWIESTNLSRALAPLLLLGLALGLCGCPNFAFGDPYTESRITNRTGAPIAVQLALDAVQYGEGTPTPEDVQEMLAQFEFGEGVTAISNDLTLMTGTFSVEPEGYLVLNHSMGTEPSYPFEWIAITHGKTVLRFEGEAEIRQGLGEGTQSQFNLEITGR